MSEPEYYGIDIKLKVLNTEASVVSAGRWAGSTEISVSQAKRQVSSAERFAPGRNSGAARGAIHERHRAQKRQSTEKSVDRRGEPSGESGAIRTCRRAGEAAHGAIRRWRGTPSVECGAIHVGAEFKVLERGAIRVAE
jgi:hypothetical protein